MASGISSRFQLLSQRSGQVSHVLRTRSPLGLPEQAPWTSFDLHVLSTPPAFILSQDQTLQQKRGQLSRPPKWLFESATIVSERIVRVGKDSCGRYVLAVWPIHCTKRGTADNHGCCRQGRRQQKLTDSSVSTPKDGRVLPALAFCLLFRFQGAEAQARTRTGDCLAGFLRSALVPSGLSGGVDPSVRRS